MNNYNYFSISTIEIYLPLSANKITNKRMRHCYQLGNKYYLLTP